MCPDLISKLISISQARRNIFKTIIDRYKEDPGNGVMELMHKLSSEMKIIAIETIHGLYEEVVTTSDGEANVTSVSSKPEWNRRMGNFCQNFLKATFPHVNGIKEKGTKDDMSGCESAKYANQHQHYGSLEKEKMMTTLNLWKESTQTWLGR